MLFTAIDDKQAIVKNVKNGMYRQVRLYERAGEIYVGMSGGFIRLRNDHATSNPNIKWEVLEIEYARATTLSGGLQIVRRQLKAA